MKTVALLTGKGNNTLKDKNILDVLGHPVLYYTANAARKCTLIDGFYCSSDSEKILAEAAQLGYKRIVRPDYLALPDSQHEDCIRHALEVMEEKPDILVVLLANNVTVKSEWITDCIEMLEKDSGVTAVVPVYEDNDHHPLRAKKMRSDGCLSMYEEGVQGKVSTNRQDLTKCYFLAHNFWVIRTSNLNSGASGQAPWKFMGDTIKPYFIEDSFDIHKEIDLYIAAEWIKRNYED